MDPVDLTPQLDQLAENVDDLQEALRPLLKNALSDTAANMPLLDKAKLYVLMVYSIESLLFCKSLEITGVECWLTDNTSLSETQ